MCKSDFEDVKLLISWLWVNQKGNYPGGADLTVSPLNLDLEDREEIRDLKTKRYAPPVFLELPVGATWQRTVGGL